MVNINVPYEREEIAELYETKIPMKWSWKKMHLIQNRLWKKHNSVEEKEE